LIALLRIVYLYTVVGLIFVLDLQLFDEFGQDRIVLF